MGKSQVKNMEGLEIRIETKEDAEKGKLAFADLKGKTVVTGKKMVVGIQQDMTAEHKSAVNVVIELPDGTFVAYALTENLFDGLVSAFKGATDRFAEGKSENKEPDVSVAEPIQSGREILIATGVQTLKVEYPEITEETLLTTYKDDFKSLLNEVMKAYEVDEDFKKLYREVGGIIE